MAVRFHVLGPLRVVDGAGRQITPRGPQQRRLLTALAVRAPEPVAVGELEDLLWPRGAPSPNALQAAVSKLRRVVTPVPIEADGRGYALRIDPAADEVDAHRFEALVATGDHRGAAELVYGEPLADIADAGFGAAAHTRLAGLARTVRRRRLGDLVADDPVAATAELEALVREEPLDESAWAELMRATYLAGHQVEALRVYQRARTALAAEAGVEPGPALRAMERRVLDHDPGLGSGARAAAPAPERSASATARPGRGHLPAPTAAFVGRERELAEVAEALAGHRLVTVVGPGGAGKTTTAIEFARRHAPDAAALVELAPTGGRDGIARAIGRAIGLADAEPAAPRGANPYGEPLDRVLDALADTTVLLVIDNCEHVVDDAATVVHRMLAECPAVRVVATSREPLGVPGERIYPLPPLPGADAVDLFRRRAGEHAAAATLDGVADARVAELCARLDGLPLAIELAAARLRTMTVDELIARLSDRFALLSSGPRTAAPRQQTLRALVDWSHDLLDPVERVVFRRLAAFVGGTDAEGAAVVCAGPAPEGVDVAALEVTDTIARLVDKSLVVAEPGSAGVRFSLLQTIADYAGEQLARSGEREAVVAEHARYFAALIAPALRGLAGHDQAGWLALISRERSNLDAALEVALAREDARLALALTAPLGWYSFMASELDAGIESLTAALACPGELVPDVRAVALGLAGWLSANGPAVEHAVAMTTEAFDLLDRVDDAWSRGLIVATHVMCLFFSARVESAAAHLSLLSEVADRSGDPWITGLSRVVTGEIVRFQGDIARAEALFDAAARDFELAGDRFLYALVITESSELAELVGDYDRAAALLEQGIAIAGEVGFSGHPTALFARLGNVEILRGDLAAAERHHRAVLDDPSTVGVPWLEAMARTGMAMIARRRGDFDVADVHLEAAWNLPRSQAVPVMRAAVLGARGYAADARGDAGRALALQREAVTVALRVGTPRVVANALEGVAGALALLDDPGARELGCRLLGRAERLREGSGGPMPAAERYDLDRAEARLRAALGDVRYDACFAAGTDESVDRLVAAIAAIAPTG